ncbi:MAG: hypothetical protein JJW00_05295, partial [Sulfurimonas sp.]|nr:hypothetical protein [Sulfurimonas sp.]
MIFLLGGYDLEMLTIKLLLKSNNIKYIDKSLKWGAKLSDYKDELSMAGTIYGIELEEDMDRPQNYVGIDHHNNYSHKPSSIEQVAKLLEIELTRHQKLVALNDRSYIKGMESIDASEDEIEYIRKLDREAQGISQDDENLAIESISESKNSHIIYAKTSKFSAISDRIYNKFQKYIIYNDTKIVFYGYKIENIISFLNIQNITKINYYYGGGDFGFIGIKDNILDKL